MNWGNNGWPLSRKKTVRLLVALTILVWATQTLMAQWGLGAEVGAPATASAEGLDAAAEEKFVPGTARFAAGATIEIRAEATVVGEEVRLRQIARWAEQDERVLAPVGDLILARVGQGTPFRSINLDEVKQMLRDAGVNIAAINFVGSNSCTVNRSDVAYDEAVALQQWIEAKTQSPEAVAEARPAGGAAQAVAVADEPAAEPVGQEDDAVRTLRKLLVEKLASRLGLDPRSLQVDFRPEDQQLLNLAEPLFRFEIEPGRGRGLGEVSWLVLVVSGDDVRKATVTAHARAWQQQLVLARPVAVKQVITDEDLIDRRTLVDRLDDEPMLARSEVVGQQAARDLSSGTVLTPSLIEAVQLVRAGQFVTVTLTQGTVHIKTVAKALESGAYGQTIRVKNEATRDVFQVILTGPQAATMNLASPPPPPQPRQSQPAAQDPGEFASTGNE